MSVALLPATGEAIVSPSPAQMTMTDQADMLCCPCCKAQDDSKATTCVLICAVHAGAILPAMIGATPRAAEKSRRSFVNETSDGLLRAPPTHPPPA
jgi:hypothetical protein